MAKKKTMDRKAEGEFQVSTSVEDLLLAAQERDDYSLETGRYLITFKEGAVDEGLRSLKAQARLQRPGYQAR
jgi:hypothetical protein